MRAKEYKYVVYSDNSEGIHFAGVYNDYNKAQERVAFCNENWNDTGDGWQIAELWEQEVEDPVYENLEV